MFKYPIAVLSFNRPDYLREVLISLMNQKVALDPASIHLFQDGAKSRFGESLRCDPRGVSECEEVFRSIVPEGKIFSSSENLGVALNFERAENYLFGEKGYEAAVFLEDDLVLQPDYLFVLTQHLAFALNEPRVGYVAAYGLHQLDLTEQRLRRSEIVPLEHKWAFGLTRRQWMAQQTIVNGYLDIVRDREYRLRDHEAVRSYFRSLGYSSAGTSQDAAKDVAGLVLGTVKLNSVPCYAHYIGRIGEHFDNEAFEAGGYGRTQVFTGPIPKFKYPSKARLRTLLNQARARFELPSDSVRSTAPPANANDADGLEPATALAADLGIDVGFSSGDLDLLYKYISKVPSYLEYGTGFGMLMASCLGVDQIVAIDSDRDRVARLQRAPVLNSSQISFVAINLGKTGPYGVPLDYSLASDWSRYYCCAWAEFKVQPSAIMLNGRFRVACALQSLVRHDGKPTILLKDFWERPHYHVLLDFFDIVEKSSGVVALRKKSSVDYRLVGQRISEYAVDFR